MAQLRWAFVALAAKRRVLANPLGGARFPAQDEWGTQSRRRSRVSSTE